MPKHNLTCKSCIIKWKDMIGESYEYHLEATLRVVFGTHQMCGFLLLTVGGVLVANLLPNGKQCNVTMLL